MRHRAHGEGCKGAGIERKPCPSKFLKGYVKGKRETTVSEVINSGGEFIGHYHFETKGKTDEELVDARMKCAEYLKEKMT